MASMLIFAIAFAVGCLSGVLYWAYRQRRDDSKGAQPIWPMRSDKSHTGHPSSTDKMREPQGLR
jgi:hypothetical protein